jgi:hypothetical protein
MIPQRISNEFQMKFQPISNEKVRGKRFCETQKKVREFRLLLVVDHEIECAMPVYRFGFL